MENPTDQGDLIHSVIESAMDRSRVTLERHLVAIIEERNRRYEQRFNIIEQTLQENRQNVKDALSITGKAASEARASLDTRLDVFDRKLDAALVELAGTRGKQHGFTAVWAAVAIIVGLILSAVGVGVMVFHSSN